MPTIQGMGKKTPKKKRYGNDTDRRLLRKKAYRSTEWRKLREAYLEQHPLCEECKRKGIINAGSPDNPLSIHHIKSPFVTGEIDWELLLDESNLMTVCQTCHADIHNNQRGMGVKAMMDYLDSLLPDDKS